MKVLQINCNDNVAVALEDIQKGEIISCGSLCIKAAEDILQGHKVALKNIAESENIIKYGVPIGKAVKDICIGEKIHTNNMKTNLEGTLSYRYNFSGESPVKKSAEMFQGFLRADGKVGVRNEIWIVPTVGCVNDIARKMAEDNQDLVKDSIEGLYAFTHPYGCSQTGEDHERTKKLLASLVQNPNAAAVLVLCLGCENITHEQFLNSLGEYDKNRIQFLTCQDVEDEQKAGREMLIKCAEYASGFKRVPVPCSELVIGLKCGGSDGLSGITANPVVGKFCDMLIARGGTAVLTEVPEMFGAEKFLMDRCISKEVFIKTSDMLNNYKKYFLNHNESVSENPSPGNKEGGITTLEEKSCGCIQKGGTSPIVDAVDYGERISKKGLNLLYGPGNDLISATALTAAGANIILFTTGRGTPFGAPVPTIKIASNNRLSEQKKNWIDFNAGTTAEGEIIEKAAERLFKMVLETAGGEKTINEKSNCRSIAILKDGVTL